MKWLTKYFTSEEVNLARQDEFDIARTFSIIGMIITHCYESSGVDFSTGFGYWVIIFMGSFLGAPLFMFYMGAAIRYSRNVTAGYLAKRGLKIFVLAYLFNILRRIIPLFALGIWEHGTYPLSYYALLFCAPDILQFAGLALMTIAVVKKLNISDLVLAIFGVLCTVIGMLTSGIDFGSRMANALMGIFIGTKIEGASGGPFSYAHYFIFVALGYIYGKYWKRCKDKEGFFRHISPICAVVAILGIAAELYFKIGAIGTRDLTSYYYMDLGSALFNIICAMAMAGVYYWLHKICGQKFHNFCRIMSSNIGLVYVVHFTLERWILYTVIINILEVETTQVIILTTALVLTIISFYSAKWYRKG